MPKSTAARSSMMRALKTAIARATDAATNAHSVHEQMAREAENTWTRRRFLQTSALAATAAACAPLFKIATGCRATHQTRRIAIVGGGIAGLNCAYQLQQAGTTATVYEASKRLGGRIFSKNNVVATGITTELGAEFIDSNHHDLRQLARHFQLQLLDVQAGDENKLADTYFFDNVRYDEADLAAAISPYLKKIAADAQTLPAEVSYKAAAQIERLDKLPLDQYLLDLGMQPTDWVYKFLKAAFINEYGTEIEAQSAINFLLLTDTEPKNNQYRSYGESDERYKVVGGNSRIIQKLEEALVGQIVLDNTLIAIRQNAAKTEYTLVFATDGGTREVRADVVVLTLPFHLLAAVELAVDLPAWKLNAIHNRGFGQNAKLFLGMHHRVWRNSHYSGEFYSSEDILSGWDSSRMQGNNEGEGVITCFSGGTRGLRLHISQADTFLESLNSIFPNAKASHNARRELMQWNAYPYAKGSYTALTPGQYSTIAGREITPIGNLFFAGEHCSVDFSGYMNGGAQTGRTVAATLLKQMK